MEPSIRSFRGRFLDHLNSSLRIESISPTSTESDFPIRWPREDATASGAPYRASDRHPSATPSDSLIQRNPFSFMLFCPDLFPNAALHVLGTARLPPSY